MIRNRLLIVFLAAVVLLCACNDSTNRETYTSDTVFRGDDYIDKNVTIETKDITQENMLAIPEKYRYMFENGVNKGDFPDNSEIKRIALSKINSMDESGSVWNVIFGVIDFEEKKSEYGLRKDGNLLEPNSTQEYQLTEEDIKIYRDAFHSEYLARDATFGNGWWKIAVEYKSGECYTYEFQDEGFLYDAPENIMINYFFNKMDLSDSNRSIFSLNHEELWSINESEI